MISIASASNKQGSKTKAADQSTKQVRSKCGRFCI